MKRQHCRVMSAARRVFGKPGHMHARRTQRDPDAHVFTRGIHLTVSAKRSTNEASELHDAARAEDSAASCCLSWAGASASWLGIHVWKIDVISVDGYALIGRFAAGQPAWTQSKRIGWASTSSSADVQEASKHHTPYTNRPAKALSGVLSSAAYPVNASARGKTSVVRAGSRGSHADSDSLKCTVCPRPGRSEHRSAATHICLPHFSPHTQESCADLAKAFAVNRPCFDVQ